MAIVWQRRVAGVSYQVRSAGNSLRLYTDGVFHSQYNPGQLLTGHVWDLLMLPAFFHDPSTIKRVLVLGVGGGAVIHQLRHFAKVPEIVGIELNPVHISVARRFFKLRGKGIRLIEADAVKWLKDYRGEPFDMIIDDLFAEEEGEPVSVVDANRQWFNAMLRHLGDGGMIVRNFISREALMRSAPVSDSATAKKFSSVFQLTSHYNENFVGAFLRRASTSRELRERLSRVPGLNPRLKSSRLRYRTRRIAQLPESH